MYHRYDAAFGDWGPFLLAAATSIVIRTHAGLLACLLPDMMLSRSPAVTLILGRVILLLAAVLQLALSVIGSSNHDHLSMSNNTIKPCHLAVTELT